MAPSKKKNTERFHESDESVKLGRKLERETHMCDVKLGRKIRERDTCVT